LDDKANKFTVFMKNFHFWAILIAPLLLLTALIQATWSEQSITSGNHQIKLKNRPITFRQELNKHIAIGDSIIEVRELLEHNKFTCSYLQSDGVHDEPSERLRSFDPINPTTGGNQLFCFRQDSQVSTPFCTTTYKPAISYAQGKVTKINAYIGGWCL
jgi:hypothetical protein